MAKQGISSSSNGKNLGIGGGMLKERSLVLAVWKREMIDFYSLSFAYKFQAS